jgi:hypothetical protein
MKYFFFSIFVLIFIGLVITYINVSSLNIKQDIVEKQNIKSREEQKSILKVLATSKKYDVFPARELYLKVDLDSFRQSTILYQIILTNLNKYTIFGVEQILRLNNIRYSIIKSKKDLELFINFNKKLQANKIIKLFQSYNFNVKLKEIKTTKGIK